MMSPIVVVDNLSKNFGGKEVLRGIDLEIASGTVLGLLKPTGGRAALLWRATRQAWLTAEFA
jgi:ABC-2 type transport system ATP-binding protein